MDSTYYHYMHVVLVMFLLLLLLFALKIKSVMKRAKKWIKERDMFRLEESKSFLFHYNTHRVNLNVYFFKVHVCFFL